MNRFRLIASLVLMCCLTGTYAQQGAALDFDGIDDYVDIPAWGGEFDISHPHKKTIQVHFRSHSLAGSNVRILSTGCVNWSSGFWLGFAYGTNTLKLELSDGVGPGATVTSFLPVRGDDLWHQASVVFNGTVATLYLDGVIIGVGSTASEGPISTSGYFHIGDDATNASNSYFDGSIDEVRVWDRALCEGEILATMQCELTGAEADLRAYYNFNSGVAGGNNATVTNVQDQVGFTVGGMYNFALAGNTSNWIAPGGVTTGVACGPYTVSFSVPSKTICNGDLVTLTASGATSYTWLPGGSTALSIYLSPSVNVVYTVMALDCVRQPMPPVTVSVEVRQRPAVGILGNATPCIGSAVTFTAVGTHNYYWNNGGKATTSVYSADSNMVVTVKGTSTLTGCSSSISKVVTVSACSGIEEVNALSSFTVFPNPAHERIYLAAPFSIRSVRVTDGTGRVLVSEARDTASISVGSLPHGIYFIEVSSPERTFRRKIVID